MARGWESKSIESQMEDREARARRDAQPLSADAQERARQRAACALSRQRVLNELESCRSEARRASLEGALAFLNHELRKLDDM
jgi:hypothetical protein